jgi:hypothetical protein
MTHVKTLAREWERVTVREGSKEREQREKEKGKIENRRERQRGDWN